MNVGISLVGYVQPLVCHFCPREGKNDTQQSKSTMLPQAKAL
jgi:hypothetical protein